MTDLFVAIAVMTVLCLASGWIVWRFGYARHGQGTIVFVAISVLAAVLFLFYGAGQLFWARIVPNSAAIIYTNFAALFAALAAGWSLRLNHTPLWRRIGLATMLSIISLAAILWPLLSIAVRPPPAGGDKFKNGVALQTSWATCSPAAAATFLSAAGIRTSEAEMIPLCLTDAAGTPTLGLYRGLKLQAKRHGRALQVIDGSLENLLATDRWPVLLTVRLPFGVDDRRFTEQWGWIPGMGHTVVALNRASSGEVLIGDPAVGLEWWSEAELRLLWQGGGMRLR
jgi:hypothetical protein